MHLALRVLGIIMPSLTAKRVAFIELTKATVEKRLDAKTDRKDIMTYASLSLFTPFSPFSTDMLTRSSDTTMIEE